MCITYPRGHNLSRYAQAEGMAENVGTGQAPHATIAKDTGGTAAYPQKSHAIRLGDDSTKSENVAIPTLRLQVLK